MSKKDLPNLKDVSRIPEELQPVVEWWQTKGPKTVGILAVGIAVVVACVWWWESAKAHDDAAVLAQLAVPNESYDLGEGEVARIEQLTQLAAQDSALTTIALLERAKAYYTAAEYEAALADYDTVVADLDDPALKDIAATGRIMTLEALGRIDEALDAIATLEGEFAQSATPHYLASELVCAKARLLAAKGDKGAAKAALAGLLMGADADAKSRAEMTMTMIDAYNTKAPEVAPAAAPVETPVVEAPAPAPEAPAAEAPVVEAPAPAAEAPAQAQQ